MKTTAVKPINARELSKLFKARREDKTGEAFKATLRELAALQGLATHGHIRVVLVKDKMHLQADYEPLPVKRNKPKMRNITANKA